ncbi:MAG: 2-hydroxyacyl-CoA dehydratase [Planctomycetes bacterium]|nr:2-hydroxyacyl-CoA dehydratase [Planctomycetota bacterium]
MYTEFFRLCGFESEEIENERPRIERALTIAEIDQRDIDQAHQRVLEFFDTELLGVRKVLAIYLNQFLDLVLAREEGKRIIYSVYPPVARLGVATTLTAQDIYCHSPEIVVDVVMGQIFGKLDPILETAEANGLPPGIAQCSLNQARVGAIAKGLAPIPDITLSAGFFCDQSPKVDDLLHEVYGVENVFVDACMDSSWDEFPEINPRRVQYFAEEQRRARDKIGRIFGIEITDDSLRQAVKEYGKLWYVMQQILQMMKNEPQPISSVDLGLFYWMISSPERQTLQKGLQALQILAREVKQRVAEGKGVVRKGAPRVAWTIPHATDPGIMHMAEGCGLSIPVIVFAAVTPGEMVKSQYSTPEERSAESELRYGVYHSLSGLIYRYKSVCEAWNVDGFVQANHYSCRCSYGSLITKKALESDLNLPVLDLEWDAYDSRNHNVEKLKTKIETFAELLLAKQSH